MKNREHGTLTADRLVNKHESMKVEQKVDYENGTENQCSLNLRPSNSTSPILITEASSRVETVNGKLNL